MAVTSSGWLGRISAVAFRVAWAYLVMRVVGWRATLPERTFATCIVLGALLALVVAPVITRLPNPYGGVGPFYTFFGALAWLVTLLVPVVSFMLANRRYRMISVADAFLLAFMVGLGFDLLITVILADSGQPGAGNIVFWPPFQRQFPQAAAAGPAYWAGLVALALAAGLRFRDYLSKMPRGLGTRWSSAVPLLPAGVILVLMAAEYAALYTQARSAWLQAVLRIVRYGGLTAWVSILGLAATGWLEHRWVAKRHAGPSGTIQDMTGLIARVAGNRTAPWTAAVGALSLFKLRVQTGIVAAELSRTPTDESLVGASRTSQARARALEQGVDEHGIAAASVSSRLWLDPAARNFVGWIALATVALLSPKIALLSGAFWSLPVLQAFVGAPVMTVLNAALVAVLVWRFIVGAGAPSTSDDPGEAAQFHIDKALLSVSLGLALGAVLYPGIGAAPLPGAPWMVALQWQRVTLLLLFAVAATGMTLQGSAAWRRAPIETQRAAAIRNALLVASGALLLWLPQVMYPRLVVSLHQRLGPVLKPLYLSFYANRQDLAGFAVSNTLALAAGVVAGLVCAAAAFLLHRSSERVERFFEPSTGQAA
jgi:hypothetical protein